MTPKGKVVAGIAAAAVAIGGGFAVGNSTSSSTTHTTLSTTTTVAHLPCPFPTQDGQPCASDSVTPPQGQPGARSPLATATPPVLLPQSYSNGNLPSSALAPATGCSNGLAKAAAAIWNHIAVTVHQHTGYWLQSDGSASCYRTYPQQVQLRNYWCSVGNCGNAAVPGTSNHGWGLAVDAPPQTVAYVKQYGGGFAWQGYGSSSRGCTSDAPWESWHIHLCPSGYSGGDPGPYGSGGSSGHTFHTLKLGSKGPRVGKLTTHLALMDNLHDKATHYLAWDKRSKVYTTSVKHAVSRLQHDGHLTSDGIYGPKTAAYQANRWHFFCTHHKSKVCN